jgi:hypothetical protein
MAKIVHLEREPSKAVVAYLQSLLEEAKQGNIRAFAIATVEIGGNVGTGWEQGEELKVHALVAGAHYLATRLTKNALEIGREDD